MIAFSIFGIDIYRYGIFYFIALVSGYFFLKFLGNKKVFAQYPTVQNILDNKVEDIIIVCVLGILIGGRAGHFIIYYFQDFIANPLDFFKVWEGGMSFIGGMLGVTIGLLIFARMNKLKLSDFILLLDAIIIVVPLGIALGRLGNFLNQELYGRIIPSDYRGLSVGVVSLLKSIHVFHIYDHIDTFLRLNTNFLSIFFEGIVSLLLVAFFAYKQYKKKKIRIGFLTGVFLLNYSFFRFMFEYLRQDSAYEFVGALSKSQYFFVGFFLLGLAFLLYSQKKKQL